jgi:bacteriorhodopsin
MPINKIYIWSGYLSIIIGIIATLGISRLQWVYYAVGLGFVGMILAIINVFLNVKYFSEQERTPKGLFGLFLSSLPIIFLMLIIFKFKP